MATEVADQLHKRQRKIIHIDMDAFYASVEQLDRPELRGKPVVVGGSPQSRGVVAAASYEVRPYGVRSAMSCAEAKRRCPQAIFVRPRIKRYREVSGRIRKVFHEVTDLVEPLSLDEAYLDVTQNKLNIRYGKMAAVYIKSRIKGETGLTASAGVGPSKFIAKIASDFDKPNGLVVVRPEQVDAFISELPITKLWGVGKATAGKLQDAGITRIEHMRTLSEREVTQMLGKSGSFYWRLAHGEDEREVETERQRKSCSCEETFDQDVLDIDQLKQVMHEQAVEVAASLKKRNEPARTITLKLRYDTFQTVSRSHTLPSPTMASDEIWAVAKDLLDSTEAGARPVRLVGVGTCNLCPADQPYQQGLPFD